MSHNNPTKVAKKNGVSIIRLTASEYLTFIAGSG
jgi:hypothetical protein